jgi:hypothetical protein
MIATALLLLQALPPAAIPAGPPPPLGAIGPQELPAAGCAVFLWSAAGDRTLVAMATPARLRLAIDGRPPADLPGTGGEGTTTLGFAARTSYKGGEVSATVDLTIVARSDITAGATVPQGALTVAGPGRDTVVVPVAGLIGCRS